MRRPTNPGVPIARPTREVPVEPTTVAEHAAAGLIDPRQTVRVLLVGGPQNIADRIEAMIDNRPGKSFTLERVQHSPEALERVQAGGIHAAIVFDDLAGKSVIEGLTASSASTPVVCVVENEPDLGRPAIRARMRRDGAAATVFAPDLGGPLLETAIVGAIETWRLALELANTNRRRRVDSLTELATRDVFLERLSTAVDRRSYDAGYKFAVLFVDVDRFSRVNELVGPKWGDTILATLARRIEKAVGRNQLVARYGGDQFTVLLEGVAAAQPAAEIAARVREEIRGAFEVGDDPVYVTASIGMTHDNRGYERADEVIRDARAAATKARHGGPGRHEVFQTQMRAETIEAVRLQMALRKAVERQEFALVYQPIVDLKRERLLGLEALIRWNHASRGVVSPAEFIPVAEETSLIIPIGYWALENAVRQMAQWNQEFELGGTTGLSVNLSPKQTTDPLLGERIRSLLLTTGLPPSALKLELTESVFVEEPEATIELMEDLRELGVQVWVDDFGTGYSSLDHLQKFPVDGLKIDKAFVDPIDGSQQGAAMARTIIELSRNLAVGVVAEGIENQLQANYLRFLGCPAGQGFLFARPLSVGDTYAFLSRAMQAA